LEPARELADFPAFYRAQFAYVWRTLHRLGLRGGDAEDAAQEVFATAYRRIGDFDPARPVRPWLFGIAFRAVVGQRRRAHVRREVALDRPDMAAMGGVARDSQSELESRQLVLRALEALPVERRAVLVMHDLDGEAVPQIAEVLAIPLNTAYSRLRVARAEFEAEVARLESGGGQ
jgi:RNA polymerase sigma-70 factor (ECF subfamily)